MNKLLVICGPTASGKTKLAIRITKKLNGELISADSRQVYKRMDIGTGKDVTGSRRQVMDGIKIWGLDLVGPDYQFSVADYVKYAESVINDIWKREKLPILVGGTGFYIKGLVGGIDTLGVAPDWELRERLRYYNVERLRDELRKLDNQKLASMNKSDRNNPRRLMRAIEITTASKKSKVKSQNASWQTKFKIEDFLMIGLTASYGILYQKINERVEERVRQGVEKEIKSLLSQGYSWDNSALGITIGYREWQPYFEEKSTVSEIIQKWKHDEHAYARRQMTWFKKNKHIKWFDITEPDFVKEIEKMVNSWYNN